MLSRSISTSRQVFELSSDLSRLAFTWAIPHLDVRGVMHGNSAILRAELFPRRDDISNSDMQAMRDQWVDVGLAVLFVADSDEWLWFSGFERHQVGLRKDREADSGYPEPPTEHIRQASGNLPEDVRQVSGDAPESIRPNGMEEKGREGNGMEHNLPVAWSENGLERRVLTRFQQHTPVFSKPTENLDAIADLIQLARAHGDPNDILPRLIDLFLRLREGTVEGMSDSDRRYWGKQPFTPLAMWQCWERLCGAGHQLFQEYKERKSSAEIFDRMESGEGVVAS